MVGLPKNCRVSGWKPSKARDFFSRSIPGQKSRDIAIEDSVTAPEAS